MNRITFRIKRFKANLILWLVNHRLAGTSHFEKKRKLLNSIGFSLADGVKIVGPIFCTANLTIGENTWVGADFKVYGNGEVYIGSNCDVAPNVSFFTGGHEIGNHNRRANLGVNYIQRIGSGTWIGGGTIFIKNLNIGEGCVIGAGSLVNKDIQDDSLVAGVPFRIIRKLSK